MTTYSLDWFAAHGQAVRRYGHYLAMRCPWGEGHNDGYDAHPSLLVYADGWWRCTACDRSGEYSTLIRKLKNGGGTPVEVPKQNTSWRPPPIPEGMALDEFVWNAHSMLVEHERLQWYLKQRGMIGRIEPNLLGFYRGWYTIPFFDRQRELLGVTMRAGTAVERATGLTYATNRGIKNALWIPDYALWDKAKKVAVVFGIFDALALVDLRVAVCTNAVGGCRSFKSKWLRGEAREVVFFPDRGEEEVARQLAHRMIRARIVRLAYPDGIKDPADFLWQGKRDNLEKQLWSVM